MDTSRDTKTIFPSLLVMVGLLLPLFYLPITTEFFQFNKLMLIMLVTLIGALIWVFLIFKEKSFYMKRTGIEFSLFLFIVAIALSTIFSISKDTAVFGSQGSWYPSLYSMLVLFGFYFVITSLLNTSNLVRNVLIAFITGATIATVIGILTYYGIYLGQTDYFKSPFFNTYGSIVTLSTMASLVLVLALNTLLDTEKVTVKVLAMLSIAVNFYYVLLNYSFTNLAVLAVGIFFTFLIKEKSKIKAKASYLVPTLGMIFALTFLVLSPLTSKMFKKESVGFEQSLPLKESWIITTSVIQNNPIFGTGPSSFYMNYPRFKTATMNMGDYWNLRFGKPTNELLNVLNDFGLVGFITGTYLMVNVLKSLFKSIKNHDASEETKTLSISLFTLLTVLIFSPASFLQAAVLVLLFSLWAINSSQDKDAHVRNAKVNLSTIPAVSSLNEDSVISKDYLPYIFALPVLGLVIYTGFISFRLYAGEYFLMQSLLAVTRNDVNAVLLNQANAIRMNPRRDVYQNYLAQTNLSLASDIFAQGELDEQEKLVVNELLSQAIRSTKVASEELNPYNVDNWISRANLHNTISPVSQNGAEYAISYYNTAIQLSPTDPRLRLDLGGMYFAAKDYLSAANYFRQAILLKNDYANAHYNFAMALKELKDYANAKASLEFVKTLVAADSEDFKLVEAQIASLPAVDEQGKPTVEQLEGNQISTSPDAQEPLSQVGETTE